MKRLASAAVGLTLVAVLVASIATAASIKEIMDKAHKGDSSLLSTINGELKSDDPDWAEVQKDSMELTKLVSTLDQNDPPKGDKASWQRLCQAYTTSAKGLESAAFKKDQAASKAALAKLTGSCKACHLAHRPE